MPRSTNKKQTSRVWVQAKGMPPHMPATVLLKRRRKGRTVNDTWEVVRAQGHLDEVQSLRTVPPSGTASGRRTRKGRMMGTWEVVRAQGSLDAPHCSTLCSVLG